MPKNPPMSVHSNKDDSNLTPKLKKLLCAKAAEFSIKFNCPYPTPDCSKCFLFGEPPKNEPETFIQLPIERGKTEFNKMTEGQIRIVMILVDWGNQFKQTKNQAYAMNAVVTALEFGLFPPLWALDAISDVFRKFLKPTTKRDIGALFGCGPGKNLVKEMEIREKKRSIRYRINQKYAEGFPLMDNTHGLDAASMVAKEDGKVDFKSYEHIAKEDLTPFERLNRAFYKSQRKRNK